MAQVELIIKESIQDLIVLLVCKMRRNFETHVQLVQVVRLLVKTFRPSGRDMMVTLKI